MEQSEEIMSSEWLEKKADEAVRGIDAAISDMFVILGNPSHTDTLQLVSETPLQFGQLAKLMKIHPQKLTRNLKDLQEHSLVVKKGRKYVATVFGRHVLGIARDLSEQAKEAHAERKT